MYVRALLLIILSQVAFAKSPVGGAVALPSHGNDRTSIERSLKRARINSEKLNANNGSMLQMDTSQPLLQWPVRKSIVVTDTDVQAISNFVDHDPVEVGIQDFNCGERTYDGHRGLDISLAPFAWYMMERDNAIVVAAAAGTIVEKVNDQPERSCTIDNAGGENNVVVIEQQDGSLALYAHMRTGSLTAKSVGDSVTTGEYLGVVGSAGMSTGPHLHFEIGFWELNQNVWEWKPRDPFAGTCNGLNAESWWETQPGYRNPLLNGIATHNQAPEFPPCPETEVPHFSDSFMPGDTVYLSAYYRDQLIGLNSHLQIIMPNGNTYTEWDHASESEPFPASLWYWPFELPGNAMSGEWTFNVAFEGQTAEHKFYVNAVAPPPPVMPASNNAYNGAWYDPTRDGEGYNILTTSSGTVIYFYGSDSHGKRFWLISDVVNDVISTGKDINFVMYESTGGTHDSPIGSARGLSVWGELTFNFTSCDSGTAFLRGQDGEKSSGITKIAGVAGTICVDQPTPDGPLAGAWFDLDSEGEGFNMIVTPIGVVVYYYGFDKAGDRLWFISDLIQQTLTVGQPVLSDLFKATAGTFDQPVPSEQALVKWGTLSINVTNCDQITMIMDTEEGIKTSSTFKVASVVGLTCSN
jgi:murein DD-endopeptidase MepM/ murein hydrolase activator NlpD